MVGAVQLGLLAACIVLFVPMGMAGWHMSRNKMLFFSGAFFITLAVGVHLTPYLPSVSDFVSSVSSVVVFDSRESCLSRLHEVVWEIKPFHNDSSNFDKSWRWSKSPRVVACGFQKLGKPDASDLLNGSWVVTAGDSQARLIALSLLNLVLDLDRMESIKGDLFKRHSNYQILISEIGMKLDFIWAPYETNLTDLMMDFKRNRNYPDVLIMGTGLWHMLHETNSTDYGFSLQSLRNFSVPLLPFLPELGTDESIRSPHLFWLGMPVLINGMLNTDEKRKKMSDAIWHAYDAELRRSKLLRKSGGPFLLLDIQSLSWNCGPHCTADGMHYDGVVYEAGVQILLNALLIESHQKL